GLPIEFADQLYEQIRGFGEYGFPESHAASFALLAYVSAWLKCHYPAEFAAAILNSQPMGFYAPAQIVPDVKEQGAAVYPADINHSDWDCTLRSAGMVQMGDAPRVCQPLGKPEPTIWRQRLTSKKAIGFANIPPTATGQFEPHRSPSEPR